MLDKVSDKLMKIRYVWFVYESFFWLGSLQWIGGICSKRPFEWTIHSRI